MARLGPVAGAPHSATAPLPTSVPLFLGQSCTLGITTISPESPPARRSKLALRRGCRPLAPINKARFTNFYFVGRNSYNWRRAANQFSHPARQDRTSNQRPGASFPQYSPMFRQAGEGDLYKNALEDLDSYYRPRVGVAVDRYTFFHRKQGKEEPVEDYVSALKKLAINCRFGELHDELIHDQIVLQSSNSNNQDNLWAKGESSLQEVIDFVKRAELTGRLARMSVRLFDYNYVVQYLPGVMNTVADFLSRMPLPAKDTDEDAKEDMWVTIVDDGICKGITRDEWNTEQDLEEVMQELGVMITKGWPL
ncbi:hypothetical protein NDU88_002171 [Pleurodeles waltl]|uniref:Uncharacterized protein n=1 Tax=Pleurodeles waltl TaxID=8319 RepID=A0AAV7VZW7_PLEWA|nr:hypothetical protein NDU88_002171 [Pleurodeles waltl]